MLEFGNFSDLSMSKSKISCQRLGAKSAPNGEAILLPDATMYWPDAIIYSHGATMYSCGMTIYLPGVSKSKNVFWPIYVTVPWDLAWLTMLWPKAAMSQFGNFSKIFLTCLCHSSKKMVTLDFFINNWFHASYAHGTSDYWRNCWHCLSNQWLWIPATRRSNQTWRNSLIGRGYNQTLFTWM